MKGLKILLVLMLFGSTIFAWGFGNQITIDSDKEVYHCGFDVKPGFYACEDVHLTIHSYTYQPNVKLVFQYNYKNGSIDYMFFNGKKFGMNQNLTGKFGGLFNGLVGGDLEDFNLLPGDTEITLTPIAHGDFKWDAVLLDSNDEELARKDPWFSSSLNRRRNFNLTSTVSTLTDYQVLIILNDSNINYSLTNDDGSDLKFTWYNETSGDEQEINYWIDDWYHKGWDESGNSYVWIKAPKIDTDGETFYYYYSNTSAVNASSNGTNTMILFDNGSDVSSWTTGSGDGLKAGGGEDGTDCYYATGNSGHTMYRLVNGFEGDNKRVIVRQKTGFIGGVMRGDSVGLGEYWRVDTRGDDALLNITDWTAWVYNTGTGTTVGTDWVTSEARFYNGQIYFYLGEIFKLNFTQNGDINTQNYIGLSGDGGSTAESYFDNILIMNYTNETITKTFSSSEQIIGVVIEDPSIYEVLGFEVLLNFTVQNNGNYNISIDGNYNKTVNVTNNSWYGYFNLTKGNHSFFVEKENDSTVSNSVNFEVVDFKISHVEYNLVEGELVNSLVNVTVEHLDNVSIVSAYLNYFETDLLQTQYSMSIYDLNSTTTYCYITILTPFINNTLQEIESFNFNITSNNSETKNYGNYSQIIENSFSVSNSIENANVYDYEPFINFTINFNGSYFPTIMEYYLEDNESNNISLANNSGSTDDTNRQVKSNFVYPLSSEWNKTINFTYIYLNYNNKTKKIHLTNSEEKIYKLIIGECNSTLTTKVLNFSAWDEDSLENLTDWRLQIGLNYNPYIYSDSLAVKNYNYDESPLNNTQYLCAYMPNETLKFNITGSFFFSKSGYTTREYYFEKKTLDYTSEDLKGYLSSYASAVTITLQDYYGNRKQNYIIKIYRYDYGSATDYLVNSLKTDVNGQTSTYLTFNTVKYKFVVYDTNNQEVYQTGYMYITDSTLTITLPSSVSTRLALIDYLTGECHFKDATCEHGNCTVECSWSESQNMSDYVDYYELRVWGLTGYSFDNASKLCTNQTNSSGDGTLVCDISNQVPANKEFTNFTQFYGGLSAMKDSTRYNIIGVYAPYFPINPFEGFGFVMSFFLLLTLVFVGRRNWKVALAFFALGFVALSYLNWINLPVSALVVVILGSVILILIYKKENI